MLIRISDIQRDGAVSDQGIYLVRVDGINLRGGKTERWKDRDDDGLVWLVVVLISVVCVSVCV